MNELELYEYKKKNAERRGLACKLDVLDYANIFTVLKCEYTGKILSNPTLERIDSSKGYVRGNVIRVEYSANTIKDRSDTLEQIAERISFLENKLKGQKSEFYRIRSSELAVKVGKACICTYDKILVLKACQEYMSRKKTLKDKITTHFCLPREMSVTQIVKVVSNDFCIRAFCKGQGWIYSPLQRIKQSVRFL